jgi:hypothetical protein
MKLIFSLILLLLILNEGTAMHVLKHFDQDIMRIKEYYAEGDTSRVFSIFMKMLIQTKSLYKELNIPHPEIKGESETDNCLFMLEELAGLLHNQNWVDIYQEIYVKMHNIQQKCTNADFVELGPDNGFDDKCALCSVLSRVMENYITYHRRDVAHFVEH